MIAHPYLLKVQPSPQFLHHELNISPWEKKHFLGKKEKGEKKRRKCSKKFRKPQIPLGSPAVLYVVPAERQIFPLCTLMHSKRNQSGCLECALGQACTSYLETALIPKITALYSSFLIGLGLNMRSLELIMATCLSVCKVINKSSGASWSQWSGSHILCWTISGDAAIFPSLLRGRGAVLFW